MHRQFVVFRRSLEFEVVSDTNQLNPIFGHLAFQVFPIVAGLLIVALVVDGANYIRSRVLWLANLMSQPPFVVFLVPHRSHLAVIIESYRLFGHIFITSLFLTYFSVCAPVYIVWIFRKCYSRLSFFISDIFHLC